MKHLAITLTLLVALCGMARADDTPISTGAEIALTKSLAFEQATLFVFYKPTSSMEREFVDGLVKASAGKGVAIKRIALKTGDEPIAKQYAIAQTPMGIVYDRRGRQTGKGNTAAEIVEVAKKAADVGRIDWAMPDSPEAERLKQMIGLDDPRKLPGIMRAMSLKPEAMVAMIQIAQRMHFHDGFLKVRTKELVATYVSSLNQCPFCLTSHAGFLSNAGQSAADVDAVALGDPTKAAGLEPKEQALLEYVKVLTREPWKVRDADVEGLRKAGWTDPEIYEATFDTALFNFFNRMANAYGLDVAPDGWRPPAEKKP